MSLPRRIRESARWHTHRVYKSVKQKIRGHRRSRVFEPVDPRVRYPSYKALDDLVDVERLRALDETVSENVTRCLTGGDSVKFDTGPLLPQLFKSHNPGSRVIELTACERPTRQYFSYFDLGDPSKWHPTPVAERFPELMDFVATLPFQATSRIIVMCDDRGRAVTTHRDHANTDDLHEFVWFRTNMSKPFFVMDRARETREYLRSYTAWFDTVNQYHGADAAPHPTVSMRVDGFFTDELRARIPKPPINRASTPSYWAALEG